MNGDHSEDNLLIVQALGGLPDATRANMTGYGEDGAYFEANLNGQLVPTTVKWSKPIQERGDIRLEVVRMYHESCEILGIEPRAAGEH